MRTFMWGSPPVRWLPHLPLAPPATVRAGRPGLPGRDGRAGVCGGAGVGRHDHMRYLKVVTSLAALISHNFTASTGS